MLTNATVQQLELPNLTIVDLAKSEKKVGGSGVRVKRVS